MNEMSGCVVVWLQTQSQPDASNFRCDDLQHFSGG